MKTIEINIYEIEELEGKAKETALEALRERVDFSWFYDEAEETVKAFTKIFPVSTPYNSWLEPRLDVDDGIEELSGLRLRTYLINNFYTDIYKPKYRKHIEGEHYHRNTKVNYYEHSDRYSSSYYSSIFREASCPLTGVCYDHNLLYPIYQLIEWKDNTDMTFEELIQECFRSLKNDLKSEEEYRMSEEALIEDAEANGIEFTEDGSIYN